MAGHVYYECFFKNVTRKRKADEEEDDWWQRSRQLKRGEEAVKLVEEENALFASVTTAVAMNKNVQRGPRGPNRARDKSWWSNGYENWTDNEFVSRMRLERRTFHYIMKEIAPRIAKTPTNSQPVPYPTTVS